MNLLFRFLLVGVTSHFRRRIGLFEVARLSFRVWPADFDLYLHLNNGRYLTLMDAARLDYVIRCGLFRVMLRRRWYPVVGGAMIRYRRSIDAFQRFEIQTRLLCWDKKWVYVEQLFIRHGELMAHALVRGVFRDGRASVTPARLLRELGHQGASPPMPEWVQQWLASEDAARQA